MSDLSDDDFAPRFENWRSWCRMRGLHQAHAGSIEGRYRSPQHWDPVNPKPDWLILLNEPYAVLVNRAYSQLGDYYRRVIKVLWFKTHWRPQWQAQKLCCHHTELGDLGYRAKLMLKNRLRYVESAEKKTLVSAETN